MGFEPNGEIRNEVKIYKWKGSEEVLIDNKIKV